VETAIARSQPPRLPSTVPAYIPPGLGLGDDAARVGNGGAGSRLPKTTADSVSAKLDTYLLEPTHPTGGSKANWFKQALGFDKSNANVLADQIKFDPSKATATTMTQYGQKYEQVIRIAGANGRTIDVNFVWIHNNDGVVRLVTSIPTKK